jgi:hypothetical protein
MPPGYRNAKTVVRTWANLKLGLAFSINPARIIDPPVVVSTVGRRRQSNPPPLLKEKRFCDAAVVAKVRISGAQV